MLGIRPVAVGAALNPGDSGSAFDAQPTRFGAGTAQASGLLTGQRPGKAVAQAVLAACGGILGLGLVVVWSVAGHGLLLSVSAWVRLHHLNMAVHVQIMLWPHVAAVEPIPVGRWWWTPERFVRGVEQSAGRDRDVITTQLDVGKTSPLR